MQHIEFSRPNPELQALVETNEEDAYNEHEPLISKAVEPEEAPFEEGYGIGDEEPEGTNSYDVVDEWN